MLVHGRVTSCIKFAGSHLYTWVERGTVRVKCLAQEHNTMSPSRARTRSGRARFSKALETFRARKAIAKFQTLRLYSCFIHIFLIWREVPFIQEVSGVYTSPFLDTDGLKMALRARKVSGAFEKRAPGPHAPESSALTMRPPRFPQTPIVSNTICVYEWLQSQYHSFEGL